MRFSILVDDSLLTFSETDYSLIKPLKVGDTALEGQEWDFDTKVIQGDLIPAEAHRIAFGLDKLHIYLQYKKFEDGKWKYYFILPVQYEIPAKAKVYFVTGGRKVTVTNGDITEVYGNIVSVADFWQRVKDSSALLEPLNASIDTSRHADSPALREFATKTDAYFLPSYKGTGSSEFAGELDSIVVNNNAKTELIEIKCVDNSYVGAEIWDVKGSSSGDMGQVKSGILVNFGSLAFTVPQKFPDDYGSEREDWSYKVSYASRAAGTTPPAICLAMRLGINAKTQTLQLEYKRKPPECICPPATFSERCLGLSAEGGEIGMAYTVPDLIFWTDVKIETMVEPHNYPWGWAEALEGRVPITPGGTSIAGDYSYLAASRPYVTMFKALAGRIMALTEDAPAQLQTMVDQYKTLVASIFVTSWTYWQTQDSDAKATEHYAVFDMTYNTTLYLSLTEIVLNYERTYGLKKNRIIAPGTCWTDAQGEYYWEVRGAKAYLPAFTDVPFYSTVKSGDSYINTKEFAFLISTPCAGTLIEGDKITVEIGGIEIARTYQLGDVTYLPTIAAQNLYLHGGINGDDLYTFEIKGSINSFPNYSLDRNNPEEYYTPQLSFRIDDGIIRFQVGDLFEFAIEGGRFIWRKDGGAWSSPMQIKPEIQPFDSGLQIGFDFGVSPSFMQNDVWEIFCMQENRAENLTTPWPQRWKGAGNIVFTFPAAVTVDALIIDLHDLSGTVTFQASDFSDFHVLLHTEVLTISALICKLYSVPIIARYFRLVMTGERSIGYIFLGNRMQFSLSADHVRPLKRYTMSRQESKTTFSLFNYLREGYMVEYNSFIKNEDYVKLDDLLGYLKTNNDMPFYFVANSDYPDKLSLRAVIDIDNIEPGSDIDLNAPEANRLYTISLPIRGVA